jgi:hypothetical protein
MGIVTRTCFSGLWESLSAFTPNSSCGCAVRLIAYVQVVVQTAHDVIYVIASLIFEIVEKNYAHKSKPAIQELDQFQEPRIRRAYIHHIPSESSLDPLILHNITG